MEKVQQNDLNNSQIETTWTFADITVSTVDFDIGSTYCVRWI